MSENVLVPIEDIAKVADKFPGSYFAGAASFGKLQDKTDIEICTSGLKYMYVADPIEFIDDMDMLNIEKNALMRAML